MNQKQVGHLSATSISVNFKLSCPQRSAAAFLKGPGRRLVRLDTLLLARELWSLGVFDHFVT